MIIPNMVVDRLTWREVTLPGTVLDIIHYKYINNTKLDIVHMYTDMLCPIFDMNKNGRRYRRSEINWSVLHMHE